MRIRGILLDFYGTVVEEDDDVIRTIAEQIAVGSTEHSAKEIGSLWGGEFAAAAAAVAVAGTGFRPQRDIVISALARVLATIDSDLDPTRLCEAQFRYWRSPGMRVGSLEFLDICDVPICVVSNIDRDDIHAAIDHHLLSLPRVVTSEDVTSYKPSPEIFNAALETLGLAPEEVLHVGDSLTADVAGANALGIPVAWVNRRNRPAPEQSRIDHQITDLRELLPVLAGS